MMMKNYELEDRFISNMGAICQIIKTRNVHDDEKLCLINWKIVFLIMIL